MPPLHSSIFCSNELRSSLQDYFADKHAFGIALYLARFVSKHGGLEAL